MKKILSLLLMMSMLLTCCMCAFADEGRSLTIGANMAPQNISPFTNFTNRGPVGQYFYETLCLKDPATQDYYGVLAKNWTTEDYVTYHFEIYDYIVDSIGNPIKASDCVFSLLHGRDEAAITWIIDAVETGEYTFDLVLQDNSPSSFSTVMERGMIVSQASYEAASDGMATSCVSSAPYMVTDFVPNVSVTFEKNPNYWQTDESVQNPMYKNMTVEKLAYTKIAEASQQSISLETGAIDAYEKIANSEVANFREGGRDANDFTVITKPTDITYVQYFSREGLCGMDINLRKAISYAIDKEMLVLGAMDGNAKVPTYMGALDGMSDLTPASASEDYFKYDPAVAADYLKQSSYKGEELRLLVPNEDNHNRLAAIVQGYLLASGINCRIDSYDNAMFQSAFADPTAWDIAICQMGMRDVAFVWTFLSYDLAGGDNAALGMAVKDDQLKELLVPLMTSEGHTNENATPASDYINEMAYGQALVNTVDNWVFRKDLGVVSLPQLATSETSWICAAEFE